MENERWITLMERLEEFKWRYVLPIDKPANILYDASDIVEMRLDNFTGINEVFGVIKFSKLYDTPEPELIKRGCPKQYDMIVWFAKSHFHPIYGITYVNSRDLLTSYKWLHDVAEYTNKDVGLIMGYAQSAIVNITRKLKKLNK